MAVLAVLAFGSAAPAMAQTTLVSNTGQTSASGDTFVGPSGGQVWRQAQLFTTGSNTNGYTLSSVDVSLSDHAASNEDLTKIQVSLYSTSSGNPDTSLQVLTNPQSFSDNAINTFTASSNTTLTANTTYALVFETTDVTKRITFKYTDSDNEDSGAASGWSINNSRHVRSNAMSSTWSTSARAILIAIKGLAKPEITISGGSAVTEGTAAEFTVTASEAPNSNLTVNLSVSESAGSDYVAATDEGAKTVTINANSNSATYSVTTQSDSTDEPNGTVTVMVASGTDYTVGTTNSANVTVNDDDATPTVTLLLDNTSIGENGGVATVTAALNRASSQATTVTVSATAVSPAVAGDFTLSTNKTLTITDNDVAPTVTLVLSSSSIGEDGGSTTVTATLNHASSQATTVTVSAAAVSPAVAGDFTLSTNKTLTINAGSTSSTGTVTITAVDNTVDAPNKQVTVSGTASNTQGITNPSNKTLTITDNDAAPMVTLSLSPASINESGSGNASTVTATLNRASSQATTVTISATAVSPATTADFTLSTNTTLTINAGSTSSTGTVTITAVDNTVDAPNKSVTVSGTASNSQGITNPSNKTLTITDDDAKPTVTLVLSSSSIGENGGSTTVTATLNRASSQATTVTVSAAAVSPAVAGDFTLSTNKTLTINAGNTSSTGTVTITAVDNTVDAPDKSVTVSGTASNSQGITNPANVTLTITDNDAAPTVTLVLSSASINESGSGNASTVTATLSHASSQATTVTVSAAAVSPAVAGDFTLSTNKTLTINAGSTSSTGTVTITAVNNTVDAPNKQVTVSGTASNTQGVTNPSNKTLTILDDEGTPTVTLVLGSSSIGENGGSTTVTATLNRASSAATTVTVSAAAVSPAVAGDFTLSTNKTLTINAGSTSSTGTVTITAVDNTVDAPDKSVTVSGTASNTQGATNPANVTLTITDNDAAPMVTLALSSSSIGENGGSTTVTATLNHASSQATTVTVSAAAVSPTVAGDFTLSTNRTLTINAGSTSSTGTVTITAVDNTVDAPNKSVTVSGTASNSQGITNPTNKTLTITDNDAAPMVTLALSSSSVGENGGSTTVTASLNHASSQATTVTVSAAAVSPAVAGDFTLSANRTLTINAGSTSSTGTVTITAVDNTVDAPNKQVTVSGTASNSQGITNPTNKTLTITDNDAAPMVTLALSSSSVGENGGSTTVTATLNHASSQQTTVTVSAVAVSPAVAGDFTLSANRTLTINAGSTSSTGTVTITAVNNTVDAPDKSVTVSGTASNSQGITNPTNVTLAITDDDDAPTVTLSLNPASIGENGGSTTVTASLNHASSVVTTVTVSATAVLPTVPGDFTLSANRTLTINAGSTSSTGTVTITANNNAVAAVAARIVTVSGTASNTQGVTNPANVTLTLIDDEVALMVTLALSSDEIGENGGVSRVTASLDRASTEETTVTVSAAAVSPAVAEDFKLSANRTLTINAGSTSSTGTVTITAVNNTVDAPDKSVTVSGVASNSFGARSPEDVTLTITDDDTRGVAVTPTSLTVREGESGTYRVTLQTQPSGGSVTVAVAAPGGLTVTPSSVTFTVSDWNTAQPVTVMPDDDQDVEDDETLTLTHQVSGADYGGSEAPSVSVTVPGFEVTDEGAVQLMVPVDGRVTVPAGTAAEGEINLELPVGHEGDVVEVMEVEPPADASDPQGFRLGDTVVDISGVTLGAGETATVCLPAPGSGQAVVHRWDETAMEWVELPEPPDGSPEGQICGVTDSFSLFAVTIREADQLTEAWLARFGRTVAGHVADAVEKRLSAGPTEGVQLTLGGTDGMGDRGSWVAQTLQGLDGETELDLRQMLGNSAFALPLGESNWTAWGRGAYTEFDGKAGKLELDGEVLTGTIGVDWERGSWRLGLALSHSEGDGEAHTEEGERHDLESDLTGIHPYARWQVRDGLSAWGVLGYGEGDMESRGSDETLETDIEMRMAAFGLQGSLGTYETARGTFDLALKSDVMAVRVEADAKEDVPEVEADAGRARLLLEGSGHYPLESGGTLEPTLEVGLRYDEGDAETGLGVEVGTGLRFADASGRVNAEFSAHGLLAHEESEYDEWGVSGSLVLAPDATGRGLSLRLGSSLGVVGGETNKLWNQPDPSGPASEEPVASGGRFDAELGYGLNSLGGRGILTPYAGYERNDSSTRWRLGARLEAGEDLRLHVEGIHGDESSLEMHASVRW